MQKLPTAKKIFPNGTDTDMSLIMSTLASLKPQE